MLTGLCVNLPMNYGLTVNLMGDEGLGLCIMTSTNRRSQNRCSKSTPPKSTPHLAGTKEGSHIQFLGGGRGAEQSSAKKYKRRYVAKWPYCVQLVCDNGDAR